MRRELGVAHLFAVGRLAAGLEPGRPGTARILEQVQAFLDVELPQAEPLKKFVAAGDLIFVKGTRAACGSSVSAPPCGEGNAEAGSASEIRQRWTDEFAEMPARPPG